MNNPIAETIIKEFQANPGSKRLLAKALSIVENELPETEALMRFAEGNSGKAYRIGITGPPGAGKSTLTSAVAKLLSEAGDSVGIIAVDPTSAFTGGAILGDRFRMNEIALDSKIFIRSMATRGAMGGMAKTAFQAAELMDACGIQWIIYETVGVGQSEIDIVRFADSVVVVLVPESGDGVQAMKAGLMEIADIFVINKSDRDQSDLLKMELEGAIEMRPSSKNWVPPVLKTVATQKVGIEETLQVLRHHKTTITQNGMLEERRKQRIRQTIRDAVHRKLDASWNDPEIDRMVANSVGDILLRKTTTSEVTENIYKFLRR